MKKITFIIALMFCMMQLPAQVSDVFANGIRTVSCSDYKWITNSTNIGMRARIEAKQIEGDNAIIWTISAILQSPADFGIPAHAKLLVKTLDGQTLELQTLNKKPVSADLEFIGTSPIYRVYADYFVLEPQLQSLGQVGIEKIRFETNVGSIDHKVYKKAQKMITEQYQAINPVISQPKSFDSDF